MREDGPGSIGYRPVKQSQSSKSKRSQSSQSKQINSMAPDSVEAKDTFTRTKPDKNFMVEAGIIINNVKNDLSKAVEDWKQQQDQNLIMTPALQKQQARCENEIKRLDDLIKDAKAKGDDDAVARFEAQKELYQQQIEDCQRKIEEEQANALDPKNGLDGGNTDVDALRQADEEANLEAERQELLEQLEAAEKQETAVAGEKEKLSEPNFNAE